MEKQIRELMAKAHRATEERDTKIIMTGILPTLRKRHLDFDYMTPNARYEALDHIIKQQRGSDFELNIMGVDELITSHHNILFEACNTSFSGAHANQSRTVYFQVQLGANDCRTHFSRICKFILTLR